MPVDQNDEEISVLRRNVWRMEHEWQYFEHGWATAKNMFYDKLTMEYEDISDTAICL